MEDIILFLLASTCFFISSKRKNMGMFYSFLSKIFLSLFLNQVYNQTGQAVFLYLGTLIYLFNILILFIPNWSFLLYIFFTDLKVNVQLLAYRLILTKSFLPDIAERTIILLNMTNRYKQAIVVNDKLLKIKKTTQLLNHKLFSLLRVSDYNRANSVLDEILLTNHTNSHYLMIKADILLNLNDPQGALDYYEKVLYFKPKSLEIAYNMGRAYLELGEFEESEKKLKEVLSGNPLFLPAHTTLVKLYIKQNLKEKAIKVLGDIKTKVPKMSKELQQEITNLYQKAEQL